VCAARGHSNFCIQRIYTRRTAFIGKQLLSETCAELCDSMVLSGKPRNKLFRRNHFDNPSFTFYDIGCDTVHSALSFTEYGSGKKFLPTRCQNFVKVKRFESK